jgi:hypothetical protein
MGLFYVICHLDESLSVIYTTLMGRNSCTTAATAGYPFNGPPRTTSLNAVLPYQKKWLTTYMHRFPSLPFLRVSPFTPLPSILPVRYRRGSLEAGYCIR